MNHTGALCSPKQGQPCMRGCRLHPAPHHRARSGGSSTAQRTVQCPFSLFLPPSFFSILPFLSPSLSAPLRLSPRPAGERLVLHSRARTNHRRLEGPRAGCARPPPPFPYPPSLQGRNREPAPANQRQTGVKREARAGPRAETHYKRGAGHEPWAHSPPALTAEGRTRAATPACRPNGHRAPPAPRHENQVLQRRRRPVPARAPPWPRVRRGRAAALAPGSPRPRGEGPHRGGQRRWRRDPTPGAPSAARGGVAAARPPDAAPGVSVVQRVPAGGLAGAAGGAAAHQPHQVSAEGEVAHAGGGDGGAPRIRADPGGGGKGGGSVFNFVLLF